MTLDIPFVKYSSCGNHFVVVDELEANVLSEPELSAFAGPATDAYFGIGADNLLVLQRATEERLRVINECRRYWRAPPASSGTEFVFRMFEPDGDEAYCCGNGLLCLADHLWRRHRVESGRILVELPRRTPRVLSLGISSTSGLSWVDLGAPRRAPPDVVERSSLDPLGDDLDRVEKIQIEFRRQDLAPYSRRRILELSGYLTFTGEPHLVIFPDEGFSLAELSHSIFGGEPGVSRGDRRAQFGTWLIDRIGHYVNEHYRERFPVGVNINFARIDSHRESAEYRCFERGILRETLACGTGALAVSHVAWRLGYAKAGALRMLPHRCRWHHPDAEIRVDRHASGHCTLAAAPLRVFEGRFGAPASGALADLPDESPSTIANGYPKRARPATRLSA